MGRTSDAIAEGVAIASAAARLAIRNRILMETIAGGETFDVLVITAVAQQTLRNLADEQAAAAATVKRQHRAAWGKHSDSFGTHDYRDRDTRNLRRRRKQYDGVAKQLRILADDPAAVDALVQQARVAAWGDVESNLQRRLRVEGMRPDLDDDYLQLREARMQSLMTIDLPALAAHRRHTHPEDFADIDEANEESDADDDAPGVSGSAPPSG